MALYIYDCDLGQGFVEAESVEEARQFAVREAGSGQEVRNVRLPTNLEVSVRKSFGGRMD